MAIKVVFRYIGLHGRCTLAQHAQEKILGHVNSALTIV